MQYNEFETNALGKLKILAHIDNRALLEKQYDTPEKYIIATNFNIEDKSWDFGSYFQDFQEALEDFTERVLNTRHLKSTRQKTTEDLYDLSIMVEEIAHKTDKIEVSEYLKNEQEMEKLRNEFRQSTINDLKLHKHFLDKDPTNSFTSIRVAGVILGRIDLRNSQIESGKIKGEKEKYPYNEEQIKMIDRYYELEKRQEELDSTIENDIEEEMEY